MKKLIGLLAVVFVANMGHVFATDCTVGQEVKNGTTVIGYAFYCKDDPESQKLMSKSSFENYFGKKLVGLMAAPEDQGTKLVWSDEYSKTGITSTSVGDGLHNTIALKNLGYPAATSCWEKESRDNSSWMTRWFLPSKDELNLMHKELFSDGKNKGKFSDYWYWSSSEDYGNYAWYQGFNSGLPGDVLQDYHGKDDRYSVRCARAF